MIAQLDLRDYEIKLRQAQGKLQQAQAQLEILREGARQEDIIALEAQLQSAHTNFQEAKRNYQRHASLLADDALTQAEYDRAKTGLARARSQNERVKQELEKARTGARQEEIVVAVAKMNSLKAARDAGTIKSTNQ